MAAAGRQKPSDDPQHSYYYKRFVGQQEKDTTMLGLEERQDQELELVKFRDCTRCDGTQHLVGSFQGMGKYVCEECNMSVGYDNLADKKNFLLYRGIPFKYTKDNYGMRLSKEELDHYDS